MTVIERANARALTLEQLPYRPDLIVIDVSFISLTQGPARPCWPAPRTAFDCLAMVKPQFEVGRDRIGKGGVVRDPELRREVVQDVAAAARAEGAAVMGSAPSALEGPSGNRETFLWLAEGAPPRRRRRGRGMVRRRGGRHAPAARGHHGRPCTS